MAQSAFHCNLQRRDLHLRAGTFLFIDDGARFFVRFITGTCRTRPVFGQMGKKGSRLHAFLKGGQYYIATFRSSQNAGKVCRFTRFIGDS